MARKRTKPPESVETVENIDVVESAPGAESLGEPTDDSSEGEGTPVATEGLEVSDTASEAVGVEPDGPAAPEEADSEPGDRPGPARTAPRSVSELHLKGIIESLVFVSDKPIGAPDLAKIARADAKDVRRLLGELREEYRGRGLQLDEIAGGWQFRSSAANAPFVRELLQARPVRLTRAQVETLAIVAYRQPITRPEVDEVRGVDSGSALKVLLERDLVRMLGRKEDVGRPVLYGTTGQFLEFFGLKSLRDLPTLREFTDLTPESQATLVRALTDSEPEVPPAPTVVNASTSPTLPNAADDGTPEVEPEQSSESVSEPSQTSSPTDAADEAPLDEPAGEDTAD